MLFSKHTVVTMALGLLVTSAVYADAEADFDGNGVVDFVDFRYFLLFR